MTRRVLLVDDEPRVLDGYRRNLRRVFDLTTAIGPREGLAALEEEGPFAVVVSDLQMPEMDGIEFLTKVREHDPDTVRMMLTGQADLDASIKAVNTGGVFRFLTKPCSADNLSAALSAGVEHYRLIKAERQLVEETLQGTVAILIDVLGLIDDEGHAQMARVKASVMEMAAVLGLGQPWEVEMAATLHQLGTITLAPETAQRLRSGRPLDETEERMVERHPEAAFNLLARIPRVERVARMILLHEKPPPGRPASLRSVEDDDVVALGAHLINIALTADRLTASGLSPASAFVKLREQRGPAARGEILVAYERIHAKEMAWIEETVTVDELTSAMIVIGGVFAATGTLLVPDGHRITLPVLERLRSFAAGIGVREPIRVRIPK